LDIRIEIIRIDGVWNVTDSGPRVLQHVSEREALAAGVKMALQYHVDTGGDATVHLWEGVRDSVVFDTRTGAVDRLH